MILNIVHLFLLSIVTLLALPKSAYAACPDDAKRSIEQARETLAKPQEAFMTDRDRAGLLCLVEAVEALDAKVDRLIAGQITFEGTVKSKDGFALQGPEPTTEEGR